MEHLQKRKKESKKLNNIFINIYLTYIYQNELDKAYFQHVMAYGDFKNLTWKKAPDKINTHGLFL